MTILQAKQELLLEEPNSKIVDKAEEINICLNETRRLSKLVKDLMSLARADSNKEELKIEQHKGTIKAFHNKPKGTRFEIKL